MRETKIETYLHAQVVKYGGTTRKWVSPGHRGVPDRIVIWPLDCDACKAATVHFIETKAPKKDAKPHQAREHERLRKFGCTVLVINTKEKVDAYIREENPYAI